MAFEAWMVTTAANLVVAAVYAGLATIMFAGIARGNQWRTNPLAVATAAIFLTCTIGHSVHALHTMLPVVGLDAHTGGHARVVFGDPVLLTWDVLTAIVAVWYFTVRKRLVLLFEGAALCADLQERQRRAQQLHDDVVQGLVRAKAALDLGRRDEGHEAVSSTLESARTIISGLLGRDQLQPGDLRRAKPSGGRP